MQPLTDAQCILEAGVVFGRNGTYPRVRPAGARIARWYCRQGQQSFSLLPDCLAARLSGTLCDIEAVVVAVEEATSLEAAVEHLRPEINLPGVIRWDPTARSSRARDALDGARIDA